MQIIYRIILSLLLALQLSLAGAVLSHAHVSGDLVETAAGAASIKTVTSADISNYRDAWNALEGGRGNYPQTVFFREMKQLRDAGYRLVGDNMLPPG